MQHQYLQSCISLIKNNCRDMTDNEFQRGSQVAYDYEFKNSRQQFVSLIQVHEVGQYQSLNQTSVGMAR